MIQLEDNSQLGRILKMFKNYNKKTIEESGKVLNVVAMIKDLDESQEEERGEGASNE